ncbi:MAG: cobyric acid synthase [Leptospirales bacterium]
MSPVVNPKQKRFMVLGTGSGVGKSLIVAGLCRHARNMGLSVGPFKAQNMSNNAAVVPDGGEIGRAQFLQAQAAGLPPEVRMNPILLKPLGEGLSQVIFLGSPLGVYDIQGYRELKKKLEPKIREIFWEYARDLDVVFLEGAGSPAEINLLGEDLVNTRMARWADARAILVGDIEQGGVFASLWGTWSLLPLEERAVIHWMGINKFRGDPTLLKSGLEEMKSRTGVPILGVLNHLGALPLPDEDSFRAQAGSPEEGGQTRLLVIEWPHLSNRSDFDPFRMEPGVHLEFIGLDRLPMGRFETVFLPGTRQTVGDLERFRRSPLFDWFLRHIAEGGRVVGICGGYQMMAADLMDPDLVESGKSWTRGLDLLPFSVRFLQEKISRNVRVAINDHRGFGGASLEGWELSGYEIRHGRNLLHKEGGEIFDLRDPGTGESLGKEGLRSENGQVWGAPVHGIFEDDRFRRVVTSNPGRQSHKDPVQYSAVLEESLNLLAAQVHGAFPLLHQP